MVSRAIPVAVRNHTWIRGVPIHNQPHHRRVPLHLASDMRSSPRSLLADDAPIRILFTALARFWTWTFRLRKQWMPLSLIKIATSYWKSTRMPRHNWPRVHHKMWGLPR